MKQNPYTKYKTKNGEPLPEHLRFKGQGRPAIASTGAMNASSKSDLMGQIGNLIKAYQTGEVQQCTASAREVSAERRQYLVEAFVDKEKWNVIGESIAEDVYETVEREGFSRRFYNYSELNQGDIARVRFRKKNVVCYTAASASSVSPTIVRNDYHYLPEFYLDGRILVEERDIHQSTGDILEEKYMEAIEAIMVAEDRLWKKMADSACTVENNLTYFTTFTPLHLTQIRSQVSGWGIPAATCVLAYDLWDDIIATSGFSDWFSPIEQHELVLEGQLGSMLGMHLITDAFRLPEQKVLNPGEIYVVGPPETHGAFQQRGDLSSNPIDTYGEGKPMRGWYLFEMIAMALINVKSIAAGKRS